MIEHDVEVSILWQDNENFVEDGIQIEPFNLDKEREQGYFDDDGNFVEYVDDNETKVNIDVINYKVTNDNVFDHLCMDACRIHGWTVLKLIQNILRKNM